MTNKSLSESLLALATDASKRSKAARLREVYYEVEAALAAGVTQADVVQTLNDGGLEMTHATFKNTMQRIRAKIRGKADASAPEAPRSRTAPPPPPSTTPAQVNHVTDNIKEVETSHDPRAIDEITSAIPDLDALAKIHRKKKP